MEAEAGLQNGERQPQIPFDSPPPGGKTLGPRSFKDDKCFYVRCTGKSKGKSKGESKGKSKGKGKGKCKGKSERQMQVLRLTTPRLKNAWGPVRLIS